MGLTSQKTNKKQFKQFFMIFFRHLFCWRIPSHFNNRDVQPVGSDLVCRPTLHPNLPGKKAIFSLGRNLIKLEGTYLRRQAIGVRCLNKHLKVL